MIENIREALCNVFTNIIDYEKINGYSDIKLRERKDGISLNDIIFYRFMYSKLNTTKEGIVSALNMINKTHFSRQAFESKENNVPVKMYAKIFSDIVVLYNDYINENDRMCKSGLNKTSDNDVCKANKLIEIAMDGTYNNDNKQTQMLNMGFYNITNKVPIELKCYGYEGKNNEIKCTINYIEKNRNKFNDAILIGDRAYFSYKFLNFLNRNGIYFVIRAKGDAKNLDKDIPLKINKNTPDYDLILKLRENLRTIKCTNIYSKVIYAEKGKKNINKKNIIEVKNDCTLITNLPITPEYSDEKILELYRRRWDIEVFFKFIKSNFKFQHTKEKDKSQYEKIYLCDLIMTYIEKIIEVYYFKSNKNKNIQVNKSNIINGIFNELLNDIIKGNLTHSKLNAFCDAYIKKTPNKKDRSSPRNSKTPFSKWYIKGYAIQTKYAKIIEAINENKINVLPKNLKTISKSIVSVDGKKCIIDGKIVKWVNG